MQEEAMVITEPFTREGANHLVRSVNYGAIEEAGPEARMALLVGEVVSGDRRSQIKYVRGPAGSSTIGGAHRHAFHQSFYLLSGTMTVEMESEEPFEMKPGDLLTIPAGTLHRNLNLASEDMVWLSIQIPAN